MLKLVVLNKEVQVSHITVEDFIHLEQLPSIMLLKSIKSVYLYCYIPLPEELRKLIMSIREYEDTEWPSSGQSGCVRLSHITQNTQTAGGFLCGLCVATAAGETPAGPLCLEKSK